MTASFSQWLLEPYGAPTSTSEVNRIADFYCVEALTVCGPSSGARELTDAGSPTGEVPVEILADIASGSAPEDMRPPV
jgi:hypothetical protein